MYGFIIRYKKMKKILSFSPPQKEYKGQRVRRIGIKPPPGLLVNKFFKTN